MHFQLTSLLCLAGIAAAAPQRPAKVATAVAKARPAKITTTAPAGRPAATTAASVSSTSSDPTIQQLSLPFKDQPAFIAAMLDAHNTMRSFHVGTGNLTWNADLANAAQAQLNTHVFAHTSNNPYGENLAYLQAYPSNTFHPRHAVQLWYDEIKDYDYSKPDFSSSTGHFTQVVWKSTTQVGCAWDRGYGQYDASYRFLTCEYSPPGNYLGQFGSQVAPATGVPPAQPVYL